MVVVGDAEKFVVGNIIDGLATELDGTPVISVAIGVFIGGGDVGNIIARPTVGDCEGLAVVASEAAAVVNPRSRTTTTDTAATAAVVTKIKPSTMTTQYFRIVFVHPRALRSRASPDGAASQNTSKLLFSHVTVATKADGDWLI